MITNTQPEIDVMMNDKKEWAFVFPKGVLPEKDENTPRQQLRVVRTVAGYALTDDKNPDSTFARCPHIPKEDFNLLRKTRKVLLIEVDFSTAKVEDKGYAVLRWI